MLSYVIQTKTVNIFFILSATRNTWILVSKNIPISIFAGMQLEKLSKNRIENLFKNYDQPSLLIILKNT